MKRAYAWGLGPGQHFLGVHLPLRGAFHFSLALRRCPAPVRPITPLVNKSRTNRPSARRLSQGAAKYVELRVARALRSRGGAFIADVPGSVGPAGGDAFFVDGGGEPTGVLSGSTATPEVESVSRLCINHYDRSQSQPLSRIFKEL